MSTDKLLTAIVGVALFVIPSTVMAVESVTGTAEGVAPVTATEPATIDSWSFGESNTGMNVPPGSAGRESPTLPKPMIRESPTLPSKSMLRESPTKASTGQTNARMATGTAREEIRNKVAEEREDRMEKRASSTQERQERIIEARKKMMENRFEIMKRMITQQVDRLEKMIERLTKLADRLESRIAKIEGGDARFASSTGGGVGKVNVQDISFTKSALANTRAKLGEAKTALASAKAKAEEAVAAAEVRVAVGDVDGDGAPDVVVGDGANEEAATNVDLGKTVREELQKARQATVAAHKSLVEAISSLSNGKKTSNSATTSAQ